MTTIRAVIRNGRIEVEGPLGLPDGTVLQIPLPGGVAAAGDDDAMTPEEIAQVLAEMDRIEPLQMTEAEIAAWDAERQARREGEKARFFEHADKLGRMWE